LGLSFFPLLPFLLECSFPSCSSACSFPPLDSPRSTLSYPADAQPCRASLAYSRPLLPLASMLDSFSLHMRIHMHAYLFYPQ
jgi:hypothetical protein